MPFPPPLPPTGRANATAQLDSHPSDHNVTAAALATIVAQLTNSARGLVAQTTTFAGSAGAAGLTVATVAVAAKAGRRYLAHGTVLGHNATAGNCGAQTKDGATILFDSTATLSTAAGLIQLPLIGIFDGGAADRTATITVLAYAPAGAYIMDRGLLVVLDVGPTAPVAVP